MSIECWRQKDGEPWLHGYSFNEHDKARPWTILLDGRAFLRLGRVKWHAEWHLGSRKCGLSVHVGGRVADDDVLVFLGLPGVLTLFLSVERLFPTAWLPRGPCVTELRIHDQALWWSVWQDHCGWSSKKRRRWRHGSWHHLDSLFGPMNFTKRLLHEVETVVPMPEGNYPCTIALYQCHWQRKRAWWCLRQSRADIQCNTPIPFPGKGENSWDCDDDACYSLWTPSHTVAEAISHVVASVLGDRERRGGLGWTPREGWPAGMVKRDT